MMKLSQAGKNLGLDGALYDEWMDLFAPIREVGFACYSPGKVSAALLAALGTVLEYHSGPDYDCVSVRAEKCAGESGE